MATANSSSLALFGGTPVRDAGKPWPAWPIFDDQERQALMEVLNSGKWWYGDRVAQFEREYAAFQDAGHCITVTTGTAAGEVLLQAIGLQPGDEVIVPPYTFYATASMVIRRGGIPIFVDIDDSWCMNPDLVEAAISPRTRAIMPVHLGGRICDMDRINEIAAKHGILALEDACHSWGGKWKGKGTGALGKAGIFSFQASKNINAAEGGAIVTDDEELADLCRSITNCGRQKGGAWYSHPNLGTNARLTEFQGALLSVQLTRLEEHNRIREKNAAILDENLSKIEGLSTQLGDERITRRAYHLYCLRIDPEVFSCSREKVIEAAKAEGLPGISEGYAVPLYEQPSIANAPNAPDYSKQECPVARDICTRSGIWIGHTTLLGSEEDMHDIIAIFEKIKKNAEELDRA
ncbi:MAG TPA: DegT/DnrJ/EryC1/StrS family aminotransferase [Candidatus Hydrogenedentes bacterium]|nr:DegT/DnrJ/EryC1/StrS family aminotransferase [Candidatus Hydrogenedentota bacterium]